jgi:hypothetical protein
MKIELSLYDFFSYTIPGVLYLFEIAWINFLLFPNHNEEMILFIKGINTPFFLLLLLTAYIIGHIFGMIAKRLWRFLPNVNSIQEDALNKVIEQFPYVQFQNKNNNWLVMMALSQHVSQDKLVETTWHEAIFLMIRNLTLGIFILAAFEIVYFFYSEFIIIHLVGGLILGIIFLLMISHCKDQLKTYFLNRYSIIIGSLLNSEEIIQIRQKNAISTK